MQQSHTFASLTSQHTSQSLQKSVPAQPHRHSVTADRQTTTERRAACKQLRLRCVGTTNNEALGCTEPLVVLSEVYGD